MPAPDSARRPNIDVAIGDRRRSTNQVNVELESVITGKSPDTIWEKITWGLILVPFMGLMSGGLTWLAAKVWLEVIALF